MLETRDKILNNMFEKTLLIIENEMPHFEISAFDSHHYMSQKCGFEKLN